MPTVPLNGIHLYYEIHGRGYPLILIAGLNCDSRIWSFLLDEIKEHYQIIFFDNRGVGKSESPDAAFDISTMAQDVIALMDHLKINQAHLLGHSMGGAIALTLALKQPERINKLIIVNSLISVNRVSRFLASLFLFVRRMGFKSPYLVQAFFPRLFSKKFRNDKQRVQEVVDRYLKNPNPQSFVGLKRQLEALLKFDGRPWLKQITNPTLVIGSDEDFLCPQDSKIIAQTIPQAKFVLMTQMGHVPIMEEPERFNKIILEFLK